MAYLSVEVHLGHQQFIYLDDLCVTEKHRCHGIGTDLIKKAEQYARNISIPTIMLNVEHSNTSAFRLYEKLGYVLLKNDEHDRCSRITMRKKL
ncbi:MAG: GNAT family N-acetyltransferase [Oscillospiraceae bacterium]|nr:GNAT family N-acetyltransferase [Oscillospiraceae bacterium]